MGVTTAYLPGLIDRLQAEGLVSRARSKKDRREILVATTQKGRRTLLRLKGSVLADSLGSFEGWTDRDLRTLLDLLKRFSGGPPTERLVQLKVLR